MLILDIEVELVLLLENKITKYTCCGTKVARDRIAPPQVVRSSFEKETLTWGTMNIEQNRKQCVVDAGH